MSDKEDYIPYGEEWKREMNKLPKAVIIDVAAKIGTEKDFIIEQCNYLSDLVEMSCFALDFNDIDFYQKYGFNSGELADKFRDVLKK